MSARSDLYDAFIEWISECDELDRTGFGLLGNPALTAMVGDVFEVDYKKVSRDVERNRREVLDERKSK